LTFGGRKSVAEEGEKEGMGSCLQCRVYCPRIGVSSLKGKKKKGVSGAGGFCRDLIGQKGEKTSFGEGEEAGVILSVVTLLFENRDFKQREGSRTSHKTASS